MIRTVNEIQILDTSMNQSVEKSKKEVAKALHTDDYDVHDIINEYPDKRRMIIKVETDLNTIQADVIVSLDPEITQDQVEAGWSL